MCLNPTENRRTETAKLPRHRLKKPIHNVKEGSKPHSPADRNLQETFVFISGEMIVPSGLLEPGLCLHELAAGRAS